MNKNKIIMLSIGAVALLIVIGLAVAVYFGMEEKAELESDLDTAKSNVEKINKATIAPEQKSIDAIKANTAALEEWRTATYALVSQGDRIEDDSVTPESFKQTMVDNAREYSILSGVGDKKLVKEGFDFGFRNYILEGAMPDKAGLKALQRQWIEIGSFVKALSAAGVNELLSITVAPAEVKAAEEPQQQRGKKKARAKKDGPKPDPIVRQGYELKFLARPASFVRFMNHLAFDERFTVVDDFTISRNDDSIGTLLGAAKAEAAATGRGRGRGRGRRVEETPADDDDLQRKGLVTDPLHEPPFTVTMKIVTYDFGSKKPETEQKKEVEE